MGSKPSTKWKAPEWTNHLCSECVMHATCGAGDCPACANLVLDDAA
jgi:hypothetical protein